MKPSKHHPAAYRSLVSVLGLLALNEARLHAQASTTPATNPPTASSPTPPPPPAPAKPAVKPPATEVVGPDGETVTLSPFEVVSNNNGYQASNTMSGTRINAKLEDLASSISVVTKQQLEDTAAVDINDIFLYEANTEGMGQYTEFTIDRNFYIETTTLNPQGSNRVRGLTAANISVNNFPTFGTVPIDTYNADSIEISRGPNSNIFGLGNASGTVSVNVGDASMSRDRSQVVTRGDSYGGWRASADFNRVLKSDRLGIRVSVLRDEKGFERKPSYENINRLFASFTVRPFKNTTIRGAYESYHNHFSRANTTLPRDSITEWQAAGMPVWNPVFGATGGWRLLNGSAYTAVAYNNDTTGLPLSLLPGSLNSGFWQNPGVHVEPNGSVSAFAMSAASANTTAPTPPGTPIYRYVESGSTYRRGAAANGTPLPLFQAPSISDKSMYDWTDVNFLSPNNGREKADTYRFQVSHIFLNTPRHLLAAEVGQYREIVDKYDHSVFSRSDSGVPFVQVDVNENLIDGTANPNFLRPFIGGNVQPTTRITDQRNVAGRASLAYRLDLSNENGFLRWLGTHTFNGYGERRDMLTTSLTLREVNVTDYAWTSVADLAGLANRGNNYRIFPRYYIGDRVDRGGAIFDSAPSPTFQLGNTPFSWYTSTRGRVQEAANIQEIVTSGGSRDREIRSKGIVWQGAFWKSRDDRIGDRIVATIGWRDDRNRERSSRNLNSNSPSPTQPTSTVDPVTRLNDLSYLEIFPTPWEEKKGQSRTHGVVVKVLPWLNLNYNESGGFKPETLAYNIDNELLDNPTGKGKDYGVTLKLFDDKLVARVTRYETVEKNSRNGAITSAAVTRTLRLFFDPRASGTPTGTTPVTTYAPLPNGQDGIDLEQASTQWVIQQNIDKGTPVTVDQARAIADATYLTPMGITPEYMSRVSVIGDSGFTDVNTVTSTGTEVEVTYNPTKFWTIKVAGAQQKAVDTELGNAVNDFITKRAAQFRAITVPATSVTTANGTAGQKWWLVGATSPTATGTNTPAGFYVANVKSVIGLATANAGKPRAQTREYRVNITTNYKLAGISDAPWARNSAIGGALRWSSKAALGYYGQGPNPDPEYRGAITDYDANRPIYDDPRAEVDFWASHNLKLFSDRIRCKLQLNVRNAFEKGRLQPVAYNPDGNAWAYRIVDPRLFILTATFDL